MMQPSLFDAAPAPPPEWPEGWDRGTLLADHVEGLPLRRVHVTEYEHTSGVRIRWVHVWQPRGGEYLGARLWVWAKHGNDRAHSLHRCRPDTRFLPAPVGQWAPIHEIVARLNQEPAP